MHFNGLLVTLDATFHSWIFTARNHLRKKITSLLTKRNSIKPAHKIHTVHKQHGKVYVSTDLISILREFLKLKALAQFQTLAMRVRHIVTHVHATPLGRMDRACQTRNKKFSGQLAGVSRFAWGEIDPGIRYIGEYGCGKVLILLLLLLSSSSSSSPPSSSSSSSSSSSIIIEFLTSQL